MKSRRGGAGAAIAIVLAILALVFLGLGLAIFQSYRLLGMLIPGGTGEGSGGPYLSSGTRAGPGVACFLADEYFRDTSVSDDKDTLIKLRGVIGPRKFNALLPNIQELLSTAKQKNINAVIPLGLWNGETSYEPKRVKKAFGYGFRDSGTLPGVRNWDVQIKGVLAKIEDAIQGRGLYPPVPNGPNLTFTRLFYHYTTAMGELYDANNYRWVVNATWYGKGQYAGLTSQPVKHRVPIMQALKGNQIKCDDPAATT